MLGLNLTCTTNRGGGGGRGEVTALVCVIIHAGDNKYLSWVYAVDRKICHSGLLIGKPAE